MKKTLHLCFFGGPGVGKSATAAGVFSMLKKIGVDCEYISEFAKDLVWEEHNTALTCQPLIVGEQIFRHHKLDGKLDIVITDSPIPINLIHDGFGVTENYKNWLVEVFNMFNNVNILLTVDREARKYETVGRTENKEKAIKMDNDNIEMLQKYNIPYVKIPVNEYTELQVLKYLEDNNLIVRK